MASSTTREEMKAEGYVMVGIEKCRGPRCGAKMEVWRKPGEAVRVMDVEGIFQSHFVTCPDRDMFRRKKAPGRKADVPKTGVLF